KALVLPEAGIFGNNHGFVGEKNNLQISGLIIDWLNKNVQEGGIFPRKGHSQRRPPLIMHPPPLGRDSEDPSEQRRRHWNQKAALHNLHSTQPLASLIRRKDQKKGRKGKCPRESARSHHGRGSLERCWWLFSSLPVTAPFRHSTGCKQSTANV